MRSALVNIAIGVCVASGFAGVAYGSPLPIKLVDMAATVDPISGSRFSATDVTGIYGAPGASIYFSSASVSVLSTSIPGANRGTIDPTAGAFALNWGIDAALDVYDAPVGGSRIGTGRITGVLPETGSYDPSSLVANSQTSGPVTTQFQLLGGSPTVLAALIQNNNTINLAVAGPNLLDGVFDFDGLVNDEITIGLPAELGGGELIGDLSGALQISVVPLPAALPLMLVAVGCLGIAARCRRDGDSIRETSGPARMATP